VRVFSGCESLVGASSFEGREQVLCQLAGESRVLHFLCIRRGIAPLRFNIKFDEFEELTKLGLFISKEASSIYVHVLQISIVEPVFGECQC
jgi:hypothetical protein